jgi:catechol 2,3-dioxygenase-like lactoylglutathione lyase family enzyme
MLSHVELNVSDLEVSTRFYRSALEPLGFEKADGVDGEYARFSNGRDVVIVLCRVARAYRHRAYHRKGVGLSHLALGVESRAAVDRVAAHLGVAQWETRILESLPKELKGKLPTVEELEAELAPKGRRRS